MVAITSKANLLKEESHMPHIPLGGWSKDKSANGLALIIFITTDDGALFKTVAEKIYSIRKNTRVRGKVINHCQTEKMTSDYETPLCLMI